MMKWVMILCFFGVVVAVGAPSRSVEIEGGWLSAGRADVRIPGDAGTRLSLTRDLDADDTGYGRLRLSWRSAPRHNWQVLLVPIEVSAAGVLEKDTVYVDTLFPAGTSVDATYRFNNYRVTYRYLVYRTERLRAEVGATIFVRDAKVSLQSDTREDSRSDLGVVPLISFGVVWQCLPAPALVLDGDALAAPQGRAVDVFGGLQFSTNEHWALGAGYRILEGGADNDDVYTFALFHHLALQAVYLF
jgi:hypothetical protein